jgi:hypothetical protein
VSILLFDGHHDRQRQGDRGLVLAVRRVRADVECRTSAAGPVSIRPALDVRHHRDEVVA